MTMSAEVFFLGLMMFCVKSEDCTLIGGDPPARIYLINATESGCWCDKSDEFKGCRPCGEGGVRLHEPYLVFDMNDGKAQPSEAVRKAGTTCPRGLKDIECWKLDGRKLCFDIGVAKGSLEPRSGRDSQMEPHLLNRSAFGWVGSLTYFGFPKDETKFASNAQLEPLEADATSCGDKKSRIIAWVDIPKKGSLEAALIGPGGSYRGNSLWVANGIVKGDVPALSALADGVLWHTTGLDEFRIRDCKDKDFFVAFSGSEARAAVVNLPPEAFEPKEVEAKAERSLPHFRMYYQMLKILPKIAKECPVPVDKSGCSSKETLPLAWIGDGSGPSPVSCVVDAEEGSFEETTADAICPPSKFP